MARAARRVIGGLAQFGGGASVGTPELDGHSWQAPSVNEGKEKNDRPKLPDDVGSDLPEKGDRMTKTCPVDMYGTVWITYTCTFNGKMWKCEDHQKCNWTSATAFQAAGF
jgi:hypothetical protein